MKPILAKRILATAALAVFTTAGLAAPVTVEITGEVWGNQITASPLGDVQPGETATISLTVDSDNYLDNPDFPTRGYAIDLASFELSFSGGVTIGLTPSFDDPAYFVLRDNDPQVDGFFLSQGLDFESPLPLDQAAQISDHFGVRFQVAYGNDPLDSLDILDALGTYDFDGLQVFGMGVADGPVEDALGMDFSSMTIAAEPQEADTPVLLTPQDGAIDVDLQPEFSWEAVSSCPGEFVSLNVPGGQATWMSPDGQTVVGTYQGEGGGWLWNAETGITILPSSLKAVGQAGNGLPAAGSAPNPDEDGRTEAAIWSSADAQPQLLGGLPGGQPLDGTLSTAFGISGDGSTVVGLAYADGGAGNSNAHAFVWRESEGMSALPKLNVDRAARANGASTDGGIIWGWNDQENGFRRAVRWFNGAIEELQNGEGGPIGEATGANSDATVIVGGGLGASGQERHAWRWTAETGAVSIGDLVDFIGSNFAFGTSDDGSVIVGTTGFAIDRNATIWTAESDELRWLTDVLDELGIAVPAGWHLNTAGPISADGTVIAGWGSDGTGINSFLIRMSGDAFDYRLQVATDAGFSDVVIDETVTGTALTPVHALDGGTEYFWRVRGEAGCGETDWSAVFNFITAASVAIPGVLEMAPEALDFGKVDTGSAQNGVLTVTNAAGEDAESLMLTSISLSGDPEFAVSAGNCAVGTELEPGDFCTLEVTFSPASEGIFAGLVEVAAKDQSQTADLSGLGTDIEIVDDIFSDRFEN